MKSLVDYYDEYMSEHLINPNKQNSQSEDNEFCQVRLLDWFKDSNAVV